MGPLALAAIGAAPGLLPLGLGVAQLYKSNKINPADPVYTIPKSMDRSLAVQRNMARNSRLPGQNMIEDQISRASSDAIDAVTSGATSSQDVVQAAARIQDQQRRSLQGLATEAANMRYRSLADLASGYLKRAEYEDQEFAFNKFRPYLDQMRQKEALYAGGMTNLQQGLNTISGAATTAFGGTSGLPTGAVS